MSVIDKTVLSRRDFIKLTAGAFVMGMNLPSARLSAAVKSDGNQLNAFIVIRPDNSLVFFNPFIEMGQGTYTSIPAILAEELDVELEQMTIEQAPHGSEYRIMFNKTARFTGGSFSVRSSYDTLRQTGAAARAMLIQAAAKEWKVNPNQCSTVPGFVVFGDKKLSYGELANAASSLPVPEQVTLKDAKDFRLLGQKVARTDSLAKSTGTADFGIDTQIDGMLFAAVKQCPVFGGSVKSYSTEEAMKMPGVKYVDEIPNGIAVIASTFWHAKTALEAVTVEFDEGSNANFSSASHLQTLKSRLDDGGITAEAEGDVNKALSQAANTITADYHVPFLAHATMEPMNCTALVESDHCKVWAPNQGADFVAGTAAAITGLKADSIEVITPFLGGGFGRRFVMDYVEQAVTLANKHKGTPIKLVWTREEDTQHDFYRPMTAARYRASFDADGKPVALHITTVGEGPMSRLNPEFLANPKIDTTVIEGAEKQPYHIANKQLDYVHVPLTPVPLGYWRSVAHSFNGFIKESFIDEMAHANKVDPVQFRLSMLADAPRYAAVLKKVAEMANWNPKPKMNGDVQTAMGVALHESFGSIVAEIAEVSLNDETQIKVHKVWAAVDCGFAINPKIVGMQMESAIAFGLSAMLGEEVTMEKGRVTQTNFHTYPIMQGNMMPAIDVEIINSHAPLGGIGEVGTPPIAPAVCNALFHLTGKRIRTLPLKNTDLTAV